MLKIAFIIYRQWGYEIFKEIIKYQKVRNDFSVPLLIVNKNHQCDIRKYDKKNIRLVTVNENDNLTIYKYLKEYNINIACFYSWSWIVSNKIINEFICLCLHPSLLPKYRGGTPIQHQILKNEIKTGVTIFRMNDILDGGPIYSQEPISLSGSIQDIFNRMSDIGTLITKKLIVDAVNNNLKFREQKNLTKSQIFKRRRIEQSEIIFSDIRNMTFMQLNNLVRGLTDPYPNAYIKVRKKNIYLTQIEYYSQVVKDSEIISEVTLIKSRGNYSLAVKDGYARLIKYKIA